VDISKEVSMTIDQAQQLKLETENKIIDILNEFEKTTRLRVKAVDIEREDYVTEIGQVIRVGSSLSLRIEL
jgi:hypothetical protein